MNDLLKIIIPALIAFAATCWIHPYVLKVAKRKNIVDNPNARKLQRVPVPVLGGLTVIFGVLSGMMTYSLFGAVSDMFYISASIIVMMIVGFIDDTINLSAKFRIFVEIILVLFVIKSTGCHFNHFHGLWGVHTIPDHISIPFTVFACVGIINAVNFIDGVDGYFSGYSIVTCIFFALMFHFLGNVDMVVLAAIVGVSLVPFFLFNVFGKQSKMFIGDAGTLSLGIVYSIFVITVLSVKQTDYANAPNLGLIPFTLAVMCVPIFDTLRVMVRRILNGNSPFHPDKTHLHHLFIELGFSHIGTTLSIILINIFVVFAWFVAFKAGLSIDAQLYVVIIVGILTTFVLYPLTKLQMKRETKLHLYLTKLGKLTHAERKGFWGLAQRWADSFIVEDIEDL